MRLPQYVSTFRDRHGKARYRFRKGGVSKMLPDPAADESAFWAAYGEAMQNKPAPSKRYEDRSIAHAAHLYFRSVEYLGLKASTREHRTRWVNEVVEKHGAVPCAAFRRRHIVKAMQDAGDTPTAQHRTHRTYALLMRVALEQEWITASPVVGIKKPRLGDGAKPWKAAQIAAFRLRWPMGTEQRKALELFLSTGQRLADVCKMHLDDIDGDEIHVVQEKTGRELWAPLTAEALRSIEEAPARNGWLCGTQDGRKRSSAAMGGWFNQAAREAIGEPGYTCHGLRKTVSENLAESDATDAEIMAVTGHVTRSEVTRYTRGASQRRLAKAAANKRGKVSNPIVKPSR